jgi:hypothetical protein
LRLTSAGVASRVFGKEPSFLDVAREEWEFEQAGCRSGDRQEMVHGRRRRRHHGRQQLGRGTRHPAVDARAEPRVPDHRRGVLAAHRQELFANGVQWATDTYSLARGTALPTLQDGGKSWYFLTVDYAFGHALEHDATTVLQANGGSVVGAAKHPYGTTDFSAFVLSRASTPCGVARRRRGGPAFGGHDRRCDRSTRNGYRRWQNRRTGIVSGHLAG